MFASSIVHFISIGFFAGQYIRVAVQKVPQSDTGRWIFLVSGLMAVKRELSRLERAQKKLIA